MSFIEDLFEQIDELDTVKESKKKDPDAKVRNRPNPVFDAKDERVKDNKDHFPLGSEKQARNALARANQYKRSPRWFNGTVKELRKVVADTVKKEFPSIDVSDESYEGKE